LLAAKQPSIGVCHNNIHLSNWTFVGDDTYRRKAAFDLHFQPIGKAANSVVEKYGQDCEG
jgi:hypothetical protein